MQINHVSKTYRLAEKELSVLKDVNLTIAAGEFIAICGTSGSGKSTLLNILGLLDQHYHGQYSFLNQSISIYNEKELARLRNRYIGFVFQSFYLLPRISVLQNVILPLRYRENYSATEAKKCAIALLEKLNIQTLAFKKPTQLSGGEKQRVAIARALIGDPKIILADEPTGALDAKTKRETMALLQELHGHDGRTIVMITHDHEMSKYAKRILTMQNGQLSK